MTVGDNEKDKSEAIPFPKIPIVFILLGIAQQVYYGGYDGFLAIIFGLFLFGHWLYVKKTYK